MTSYGINITFFSVQAEEKVWWQEETWWDPGKSFCFIWHMARPHLVWAAFKRCKSNICTCRHAYFDTWCIQEHLCKHKCTRRNDIGMQLWECTSKKYTKPKVYGRMTLRVRRTEVKIRQGSATWKSNSEIWKQQMSVQCECGWECRVRAWKTNINSKYWNNVCILLRCAFHQKFPTLSHARNTNNLNLNLQNRMQTTQSSSKCDSCCLKVCHV